MSTVHSQNNSSNMFLKWFRKDRLPEWIASAVLLGFAFSLAIPGDTIRIGSEYVWFMEIGLDDASLAFFLGVVGVLRMCALVVNGLWKKTPYIRMWGAYVGATVFFVIGAMFLMPFSSDFRPPNTGFMTYFILALTEYYSSYQAGKDVGFNK